jgi:hypothetical protein
VFYLLHFRTALKQKNSACPELPVVSLSNPAERVPSVNSVAKNFSKNRVNLR